MSLKLEEFLTQLIIQVRNDTLSDDMTKSLTDLFLLNALTKTGKTPKMITNENNMKYYTMGWFVYNVLNSSTDKEK